MNSALIFIALAVGVALFLGIRARRGKDMSLEQWTVGGRGFGAAIVFLLMAGEIYTTFVFLGGSGFAYGNGAGAITSWDTAACRSFFPTSSFRRSGAMRRNAGCSPNPTSSLPSTKATRWAYWSPSSASSR